MIRRFAVTLAALVCLVLPAEAHRLKLFAQVTGDTVAGYGFYIGGGRPEGAEILVTKPDGTEIARLKTGKDGDFTFTPPTPGRYRLTLAGGDGHFASTDVSTDGTPAAPSPTAVTPSTSAIPADLDARIAKAVDAAVARQIGPLMEAYDAADGRVRFNDLIGGLGWIMGLAGLWAWFRSRRSGHGS
ncbi:carboxypeptidase-like regulatory domain-containing protein [Pleomorphomonas sp. NRKKF1]|uniref:carboxypeptidase-like regulatory domain-containing protein n=1 Tax=Pleomorphomonas sp. NRK KF1 TaxID=2943000 RepID=UPI00204477A3|nr:carboxypeptidase-like regulatory domain-containing protein [Pleomorphomonas sp. NRK KF1]